jgi:hypothetical protein
MTPFVPTEVEDRNLMAALDRLAAAALAAGIIAASGRAHTPAEAIEVQQQVLRTMFPPEQ